MFVVIRRIVGDMTTGSGANLSGPPPFLRNETPGSAHTSHFPCPQPFRRGIQEHFCAGFVPRAFVVAEQTNFFFPIIHSQVSIKAAMRPAALLPSINKKVDIRNDPAADCVWINCRAFPAQWGNPVGIISINLIGRLINSASSLGLHTVLICIMRLVVE